MTLRELERRARRLKLGGVWIVAAQMADGSCREMTMEELLEMYDRGDLTNGLSFKTVSGANMKQLNALLDAIGGCI